MSEENTKKCYRCTKFLDLINFNIKVNGSYNKTCKLCIWTIRCKVLDKELEFLKQNDFTKEWCNGCLKPHFIEEFLKWKDNTKKLCKFSLLRFRRSKDQVFIKRHEIYDNTEEALNSLLENTEFINYNTKCVQCGTALTSENSRKWLDKTLKTSCIKCLERISRWTTKKRKLKTKLISDSQPRVIPS